MSPWVVWVSALAPIDDTEELEEQQGGGGVVWVEEEEEEDGGGVGVGLEEQGGGVGVVEEEQLGGGVGVGLEEQHGGGVGVLGGGVGVGVGQGGGVGVAVVTLPRDALDTALERWSSPPLVPGLSSAGIVQLLTKENIQAVNLGSTLFVCMYVFLVLFC